MGIKFMQYKLHYHFAHSNFSTARPTKGSIKLTVDSSVSIKQRKVLTVLPVLYFYQQLKADLEWIESLLIFLTLTRLQVHIMFGMQPNCTIMSFCSNLIIQEGNTEVLKQKLHVLRAKISIQFFTMSTSQPYMCSTTKAKLSCLRLRFS